MLMGQIAKLTDRQLKLLKLDFEKSGTLKNIEAILELENRETLEHDEPYVELDTEELTRWMDNANSGCYVKLNSKGSNRIDVIVSEMSGNGFSEAINDSNCVALMIYSSATSELEMEDIENITNSLCDMLRTGSVILWQYQTVNDMQDMLEIKFLGLK